MRYFIGKKAPVICFYKYGNIDNIHIPWIGNAPINTCMISYPILVTARNFVTNSLVAEVVGIYCLNT